MRAARTGYRHALAWTIAAAVAWEALRRLLSIDADADAQAFCFGVWVAGAVLIAALSGRLAFGVLVASVLAGGVWLAMTLKLQYLNEPLLAPDLRYFASTTTLDVIAHYPKLVRKTQRAALKLIVLLVVAWWLESPGLWKRTPWTLRLGGSLLALGLFWLVAAPRGMFRSMYETPEWTFISETERNPVARFITSFARMRLIVPPYDAADADRFDWGAEATAPVSSERPDIVVVLEESTLDPRQWAACTAVTCTSDLFAPIEATRASGLLRVHTYGGATWTSEFALFAGLPHTAFGPAGLYAPFNLAPRIRHSLPAHLRTLGYRTLAIYPMPRHFVRAADAYAEYGFDEFHDSAEMGLVWESTDLDLMQHALRFVREARAKDDRPVFAMILTMRQHGPHDKPLDGLPPPWNQPPIPNGDERTNRNLGTYLHRLHQSAEAVAALRNGVFASGRATVLAHFGDHHPSFDGVESHLASALPEALRAEAGALTYYRIESNRPGETRAFPEPLDIAYLAASILDVAGLPRGAWFEANARLRDRCRGHFEDCPDREALQSWLAYAFDRLHAIER